MVREDGIAEDGADDQLAAHRAAFDDQFLAAAWVLDQAAWEEVLTGDAADADAEEHPRRPLRRRSPGTEVGATPVVIVVRLRYCAATRAYLDRRIKKGRTMKEAIRCLRRYLALHVHRTLTADVNDLARAACDL